MGRLLFKEVCAYCSTDGAKAQKAARLPRAHGNAIIAAAAGAAARGLPVQGGCAERLRPGNEDTAMTKEKIARINALAAKSKTPEGLTEAEKAEQKALRSEYVAEVRQSLKAQLDHTSVQEPDGTVHRLQPKKPLPRS